MLGPYVIWVIKSHQLWVWKLNSSPIFIFSPLKRPIRPYDFNTRDMLCLKDYLYHICLILRNDLTKELSLCHKLKFFNPNIFATQCRRPQIFQTLNYVSSNNVSLKYQMPTRSGCKDIGIRKFEFVAKTQILQSLGYTEYHPPKKLGN